MQHEKIADSEVAVETAGRLAWTKPQIAAIPLDERTEGAFIPGPAEIPSLCS